MTRRSILEYANAIRKRYLKSDKKRKTQILDEFVATTGMHRKAAIRLLNRHSQAVNKGKRGRPRLYDLEALAALKIAWETSDRLCSKRLQPFLPELLRILQAKGEVRMNEGTYQQICRMSPSTIDRITRKWGRGKPRGGLSTTKPGTLLKSAIPVRTFSEWNDSRPGFVEVDLVAHCGDDTENFYLTTLSAVDVATGWYEPVAVWGKGQARVGGAIHDVRQRLPVPMLGLDSDNGSEFINRSLYAYCQQHHITFTRSRSYKKNDSCHVEQKNWVVIRKTIGYHRFSSQKAFETLNNVYVALRLYINFFQPVRKLVKKTRHGAKVHKIYDIAQTPYQRMLKSGAMSPEKARQLAAILFCSQPQNSTQADQTDMSASLDDG